jgi:putative sterol carrier protein
MSANHTQEDKTMAFSTAQEALQGISSADPARYAGIEAVLLFDLTGDGGGKWTLTLSSEGAKLEEGETATPAMTLSMNSSDFVSMSNGDLNAMAAFMQGKIKISGDMSLAMRLQNILA